MVRSNANSRKWPKIDRIITEVEVVPAQIRVQNLKV